MITMELDAKGLEPLKAGLKQLAAVGNVIEAVELNPIDRKDGGPSNAEILGWLDDLEYKFTQTDASENEDIAEAWTKMFEKFKHTLFSRGNQNSKGLAINVAGKSFRAAMLKFMEIVSDNINTGRTHGKTVLEPSTIETKQREHGFAYPIGKATGELLANLSPKGPAERNIRMKRK
jgi:hypothetical protein